MDLLRRRYTQHGGWALPGPPLGIPFELNKEGEQFDNLEGFFPILQNSENHFRNFLDNSRAVKVGGPRFVTDSIIGKKINFVDAEDQYFDTGISMNSRTEFTISVWMQRRVANDLCIVSSSSANNARTVQISFFSDGILYFAVNNGALRFWSISLNDTLLHHIVMRYDGGGATDAEKGRVWIDRQEVGLSYGGAVSTSSHASAGNLYLGFRVVSGLRTDGFIGPMQFYDVALPEGVISSINSPSTQWELSQPLLQQFPAIVAVPPPVGAIMNQLQGPNVGADLYNGTLL